MKLLRNTLLALTTLLALIALAEARTSATMLAAPAASTSYMNETVEILPAADTYIASNQTLAIFSDSPILEVSQSLEVADSGAAIISHRHTLLRFDLDTIPAGAVVQNAELMLFQREASEEWNLDINIILADWTAKTTSWDTRPRSTTYYEGLSSSTAIEEQVRFDVTGLVQDWYQDPQISNFGLEIEGPRFNNDTLRRFDSSEGEFPPKLVITYAAPADLADVFYTQTEIDIDGVCDTDTEYAGATAYFYADVDGSAHPVYIVHDTRNLYVCAEGTNGTNLDRLFTLLIDTDDGREKYADSDDLQFQVDVTDGQTRDFQGNPNVQGEYLPGQFSNFSAAAVPDRTSPEAAEFRISIAELALPTACGAPFGIAIFHQGVMSTNDIAGWPSTATIGNPVTWLQAYLRPQQNKVCVCETNADICLPAQDATVYRLNDQISYAVDANGFVMDDGALTTGDQIWATQQISATDRYQLLNTSGAPVELARSSYGPTPPGIFKLVVDNQHPLMIHDLQVSTQWNLEGDPQYKQLLAGRIRNASDVLYDVTNGQFVWGDVTVYQNYENWFDADVWLYADNNLRPAAYPGGILSQRVADPVNADVVYRPGQIYIGSHWNRYNLPPGQPLPDPVDIATDWERALAHEWGHYFFFQFDTYVNFIDKKVVQTDTCTGSIMGWAYFDEQTEFVFEPEHWQNNCGLTVANHLLQRPEWATAGLWWPWLVQPTSLDDGPSTPPMSFTEVSFVPPTGAQMPLANQLFDLGYQDNESASPEAKTFVFRDDRAFINAKPAAGATQVELIGVQPNDRLCVIDLNDNAEGASAPRYQFGCESLQAGDNHILLEKDTSWAPVIEVDPLSGSDFVVTVKQQLPPGVDLQARLYPEHKAGSTTVNLFGGNGLYTGTFNLPEFTPAAFVQVWVDETDSPTDKRRESIVDFGVAKGGEPGPSSGMEQAPVYASSGLFYYLVDSLVELSPGEFVAIQSTAGTESLPPDARPIVQGYRLIAYPPERVDTGAINILYPLESGQQQVELSAVAQHGGALSVYYWDGVSWTALDTVLSETQNGYGLASAESQGVGTYILTESNGEDVLFIPHISQ